MDWNFDHKLKMFVACSRWEDEGTPFLHRFKHTPKSGFVLCSQEELMPEGKKSFSTLAGVVAACEKMEEG